MAVKIYKMCIKINIYFIFIFDPKSAPNYVIQTPNSIGSGSHPPSSEGEKTAKKPSFITAGVLQNVYSIKVRMTG